ncbi:DUF4846 domain-containing protein [Crassaminicella profunda]|uniref:DUF4846 domain-containing protein n=1 Tax=Crassaminicella profunda TaxID=1286698 RepID=UPI001CA6F2CF|nr:DUF4846 domain-containing protein [Crassaminicella profunda]QZY56924.1 DUF4846 domain-containing protein [Crassaminicella profunda]
MRKVLILVILVGLLLGCVNTEKKNNEVPDLKGNINTETNRSIINEKGLTIYDRINVPKGCTRTKVEENSFADYLRKLPLKEHNAKVSYYNGKIKENFGVYEAVVDMDIGTRNLQQCADAIMRLRGEYLFQKKDFEKIHFNLTNGFRVDYDKWIQGNRVVVDGNKTYWKKKSQKSSTYKNFRKYMDLIFSYAGTLSLSKELQAIKLEEMQIGDIFIQGGSPGHAVIVVDMAENKETGEKYYLLAQSYMPAQDIQILVNPNNRDISPWYVLNTDKEIINTPEWTFTKDDLKRFDD